MSGTLRRIRAGVLGVLLTAGLAVALPPTANAGPCDAPTNPIVCENSKAGSPQSDWWVDGTYGDIDGYTTQMSVQPGERLDLKVKTPSTNYQVDIYRLGYYGGNGARLQTSLSPTVSLPQTQPTCLKDSASGMTDCGNWKVSTSWQVPSTAVPGFYVANFIRNDAPGASQAYFVVRSDASHSDMVVQTSDQTWEAYNTYGNSITPGDPNNPEANSLYVGNFGSSDGRAYKASYNRPYLNSGTASPMNAEYPLIRFLERNGYDVSYLSGVDVTRNPALLKNHKVFVSSGHDEYVNATQRAGIESARAAGVNMIFMSGNEMFWKTRFENSTDGTNTAYRTLVCYKETKVGTKIDPNAAWTGTWRDPRLSPPSDGGRPENAVTGTLFEVNGYRADAIQVPASFGRNRMWRNTSIASAGTTTTLTAGSLGYEWDTDPDNGYRPAGSIQNSSTTVTMVGGDFVLQDYGNAYGDGTKTHNITMYRDQTSGALVWGLGTVQWSWGLDSVHLYPPGAPASAPANLAMQQATVNVLADMGAQPRTLMAGLTAATKSTDTTGPTVTVTSPVAGSTVPAGSDQTIRGTAVDVGGGKVAAVEVSLDNGASWHKANGLDNWTYPWTPSQLGATTILVRASDDGATLGATRTVNVTVGAQQCPCTLFQNSAPTTVDSADGSAIEVGTKFTTSVNATVTGVRFYKATTNTGTHTGSIWNSAGARLVTGTFTGESASGWQTLNFTTPLQIRAGQTYVVSYTAPNGHYSVDAGYFTGKGAGIVPLTAPATGGVAGGNGVFRYGSGFPSDSFNGGNYWVDPVVTTATADNVAPTVSSTAPASGATGAYTDGTVSATFSESVDPASVQFTLKAGSTGVPGTLTVDDKVATFTPTALLAANTTYTATVTAADGFGNVMASPKTWSFTTGAGAAPCPCSLFGVQTPGIADAGDGSDVELGVKFTTSVNATVTGVKFYKSAANTGSHTGSLWTSSGTRLATGTYTGESASGWQTLTFSSPVQITAGQTYVASYRTPTGHYAADGGYFATKGAGRGVVTAPSSPSAGGQGVFEYGGGFPSNSYNSTNYWVDVVVDTAGADNTAPTITSTTPPSGATGVSTGTGVTANFSEAVNASSVQMTVTGPGGTAAGTTTVAPDAKSVTFASTGALAGSTTYTVSVQATDLQGNAMGTPYTWSFTTGAVGACPCTLFRPTDTPAASAVDSAVELGTRIKPTQNGFITGVRFYKTLGDPGTHTGTLWSSSGTQLATGTFTGESGSGWQTLTFATPVAVTAGTTYLVSYFTSAGRYGYTTQYFTADKVNGPLTGPASVAGASNGVYRYGTGGVFPAGEGGPTNYWVDAVFTTSP
ncbi:DUF4082 domain-containing protein [Labedaea rhizosphaerae]|uniref:Molybdenum-dependent oxidoreductase-like protein n=1 Tax=Labedaea rhizosphaerae TaxID=598644 RepID=A0A4R6SQF9_LABRH|nr:DUF4082 domain-containing protein [Labedaea rhizosphaerae]TDQ05513.1 molybdenum-dependent oxidoreductase-like protein [Labedaea rhizosphaerae]